MYTMCADDLIKQEEKRNIKGLILPKLKFWIKNLNRAQKQFATEDTEKASGFFFDSLYLLNHIHPSDYEVVTEELTKLVNSTNEARAKLHNSPT